MSNIKNVIVAFSALLYLNNSILAKERVVIIGSGLSGLSTAMKLIEERGQDVEIEIYEGLDRVGGRTHSMQIGKGYVEAGTTFINQDHTELLALAKRFNLPIAKLPGKQNREFSYLFNGRMYSEKEVYNQLLPFFREIEVDRKS